MNAPTDPLDDLPPADDPEAPASVGSAETADGMIGEMTMAVPRGDPRYAGFVAHLGGMKPGDAKPIPPFPEPEIDPKSI